VHDLIHTRADSDADWTLTARSYRKLRLSHAWVLEQLRTAGLRVRHEESGAGGLRTVVLERAARSRTYS